MDYENTPQHDEINLVRLVRRIEKSVANKAEWTPSLAQPTEEIWLRVQKVLQNVKYARKLMKNVEVDDLDPSLKRIYQLNDIRMKLDRFGTFFKDVEQSSKPKPKRPEPILPTLPIPEPPRTPINASLSGEVVQQSRDGTSSPPPYSEPTSIPSSPKISTQGLFISPPDADEISPTLLTSTLPSLLPSNPAETAAASAYSRSFGPTPTARKLAGAHTSTALQEELSSQLEVMAQQLKRNALHFSNSLEKDKAVIEDAGLKLEGNYDVMLKERLRLRDHRGKSRSTTCLIMGVVLLVVVVFMLMVSVIRFS